MVWNSIGGSDPELLEKERVPRGDLCEAAPPWQGRNAEQRELAQTSSYVLVGRNYGTRYGIRHLRALTFNHLIPQLGQ